MHSVSIYVHSDYSVSCQDPQTDKCSTVADYPRVPQIKSPEFGRDNLWEFGLQERKYCLFDCLRLTRANSNTLSWVLHFNPSPVGLGTYIMMRLILALLISSLWVPNLMVGVTFCAGVLPFSLLGSFVLLATCHTDLTTCTFDTYMHPIQKKIYVALHLATQGVEVGLTGQEQVPKVSGLEGSRYTPGENERGAKPDLGVDMEPNN